MLDEEQYILSKIAEEATEVAHRALKAQQYGMYEIQEGQEDTNVFRFIEELEQLNNWVKSLLARQGEDLPGIKGTTSSNFITKANKYLELSKKSNKTWRDVEIKFP